MADRFLGEYEPVAGRWVWPFASMEEGDWFLVSHELRDPEKLRQMVAVRGSQLGKRFQVEKSAQGYEGFAKVECKAQQARLREVLDYEAIMELLRRHYPTAMVDNLKWTGLDVGEVEQRRAPREGQSMRVEYLVTIPAAWTFVVCLFADGFQVERVEQGATLEAWREARLQEVMD